MVHDDAPRHGEAHGAGESPPQRGLPGGDVPVPALTNTPGSETVRPKLGIAVIGCGRWGVNHVRVFDRLPDSHVAAVCDGRLEQLDAVGRQFPNVALSSEVAEMLQLPGVDAVVICTPAQTHAEIATRCIEAGKHVLVEKPLTTSAVAAEGLIRRAAVQGVTLMVGHTFLFNASVLKVKDLVSSPGSGRIYYLYSRRTNLGPIRRDVSALWDLASHDVAIFGYMLDERPSWVSAVGVRALGNAREDVGFVALGYPSGVIGHIHVSWADPNKVRELVVVGERHRVVFNDLDPQESVRVFDRGVTSVAADESALGEFTLHLRDGDILSPKIDMSEPLRNQAAHFVSCIEEGVRPLTDGEAGRDVVMVMEAIERSVRANGAPMAVAAASLSALV